jgi:hypothetical protein
MSLMSMLDEQTVLVDPLWLAVETVELLKSSGLRLIKIEEMRNAIRWPATCLPGQEARDCAV